MNARRTVAWALGVAATLYLAFGVYAWTIASLGVHFPLSRRLPFPPLQWLVETQHLSQMVVTVFLALVLMLVVAQLRHRRVELRMPRWGLVVVALMVVALVAELAAVVWQYYIWDLSCRGCTIEEKLDNVRAQGIIEYVGILAQLVGYWCLLVIIAGALAASRFIDTDVHTSTTS